MKPHRHKGRFYNYPGEKKQPFLFHSLIMYCKGFATRRTRRDELALWHAGVHKSEAAQDAVSLTWIGHSSFLLRSPLGNILTDPVFGDLTFLFKRMHRPGLLVHELPTIDVVLISHNHRDHMDKRSLQAIAQRFPHCIFYVPQGDKQWLNRWGIERVVELTWGDGATLSSGMHLTFLPAVHWSQRSLFDYNKSLWGSWMIDLAGMRIYFAGDTAYGDHFAFIAQEFTAIDYVLMPIGPCEPRAWMAASHIDAQQAGQAFLELGGKTLVPMHWGTFAFGLDDPLLPIERLLAWWHTEAPADVNLAALKIGQGLQIVEKPHLNMIYTLTESESGVTNSAGDRIAS